MKLCYIGRVQTNWWPRRVLCALWTWRPIVKVAMGCCMEPAAVHMAHVVRRLHFFQFFNFFIIYTTCLKKITHPYRKIKFHIFLIIHTTYHKKNTCIYRKKKYTAGRFFLHDLCFSPAKPSSRTAHPSSRVSLQSSPSEPPNGAYYLRQTMNGLDSIACAGWGPWHCGVSGLCCTSLRNRGGGRVKSNGGCAARYARAVRVLCTKIVQYHTQTA